MYREEILDHYRYPHNFGTLATPTSKHRAFNPLCGDDITVQLMIKNGIITDAKFTGHGCAISMAAASMLTDELIGKNMNAVQLDKEFVLGLLNIPISLGRMKCATLALSAVRTCIGGTQC